MGSAVKQTTLMVITQPICDAKFRTFLFELSGHFCTNVMFWNIILDLAKTNNPLWILSFFVATCHTRQKKTHTHPFDFVLDHLISAPVPFRFRFWEFWDDSIAHPLHVLCSIKSRDLGCLSTGTKAEAPWGSCRMDSRWNVSYDILLVFWSIFRLKSVTNSPDSFGSFSFKTLPHLSKKRK